jgi:hypothetical protein
VLKNIKNDTYNNNVTVISLDKIFCDITLITNVNKNVSKEKKRDIQSMFPVMSQIDTEFYSVTVSK